MLSFLRIFSKRLLYLLITMFLTTAILYGVLMLIPVGARAIIFLPNLPPHLTDEQYARMIRLAIQENHLQDPYPVQYFYWLKNLVHGDLGYSHSLHEEVFSAIIRRAPVTIELTLYAIVLFFPLGLLSGTIAGSRQNSLVDYLLRFIAYIATSLPPFILALLLLAFFYVNLHWFSPERLGLAANKIVSSDGFRQYTGMMTLDGFLNGQPAVSLDALRHLVMPIITLALAHWATLSLVTRRTLIEEQSKDYVLAAKARGLSNPQITWRHTLPNIISPTLTSSFFSIASLVSGVFVVEIIFGFHGISELAVSSMTTNFDIAGGLGFSLYSVFVVVVLMAILDLIQSILLSRSQGDKI